MTDMTTTKPAPTCEVTVTRIFDAPRSLVFKTWTEPRHMAKWWGPRDFTNPLCELDVRVGGKILIHMRGPNGVVHPMTGVFHEIVPSERLVFTAVVEDRDGHSVLEGFITVTFEDLGGKTKLTVHEKAIGFTPAATRMLAGMEVGWAQSLTRLESVVKRD